MALESADQKLVSREIAKRRAFIFLFIPLIALLSFFITQEADEVAHALDDYVIIALSIASLLIIALMWKKQSLQQLRKQHNQILIMMIVALAFQLFAFAAEYNDPADFGNEVPSLLALILVYINGFA